MLRRVLTAVAGESTAVYTTAVPFAFVARSYAPAVGVVVLTALGLEYEAVRRYLLNPREFVDSDGTRYEIGEPREGPVRIALALIGEGNLAAAALASRAIEGFAPAALLLVGVAGGLSDSVALGDVVVATRIYAYHSGRERSQEFLPRPRGWPIPHGLEQTARTVAQSPAWTGPTVHFKPLVSGEVVLDSRQSPAARLIASHYSDAVAIDMESAGVAEASHRKDFYRAVTIRAISDAADGTKRRADADGWQHRAAANAAAFAVALAVRIGQTARARWRLRDLLYALTPPIVRGSRRSQSLAVGVGVSILALAGLGVYFVTGHLAAGRSTTAAQSSHPRVLTTGWQAAGQFTAISLSAETAIDLETRSRSDFHSGVSSNAPAADVGLSGNAEWFEAVRLPAAMAVLNDPGPHDPARCVNRKEPWTGSRFSPKQLLKVGTDICVRTYEQNMAILTIRVLPDSFTDTIVFDYTLWKPA